MAGCTTFKGGAGCTAGKGSVTVGNVAGSKGSAASTTCSVDSSRFTTLSIILSKAARDGDVVIFDVAIFDGNELASCKFAEEVDDGEENELQVDLNADTMHCMFSSYEATARCRRRLLRVPPICNGK